MAALMQLLLAVVLGVFTWFMVNLTDVADPWPIVLGVIVFLLVLGVSVIFVDSDFLD